ncbi:hypothetical protein [Sporosarcina globispora]|uniref:hypothetical protein n=1 Tax=Sporosarcina globispora TaxID=1459 RepID=UPI000AFA062C|nr:hypothetical protein [Sporosarcina globispora]
MAGTQPETNETANKNNEQSAAGSETANSKQETKDTSSKNDDKAKTGSRVEYFKDY